MDKHGMLLLGYIVYGCVGVFLFVYVVWHAWHDIQRMTNRGIRKYLFVTLSGHDQPTMFRRDILEKARKHVIDVGWANLTIETEQAIARTLAAEFATLDSYDMLIYVAAVQNPKIQMLMPHIL